MLIANSKLSQCRESGVTTLTFAMVAPVFFGLIIGLIDLAGILYTQNTLNKAATVGAKVGGSSGGLRSEISGKKATDPEYKIFENARKSVADSAVDMAAVLGISGTSSSSARRLLSYSITDSELSSGATAKTFTAGIILPKQKAVVTLSDGSSTETVEHPMIPSTSNISKTKGWLLDNYPALIELRAVYNGILVRDFDLVARELFYVEDVRPTPGAGDPKPTSPTTTTSTTTTSTTTTTTLVCSVVWSNCSISGKAPTCPDITSTSATCPCTAAACAKSKVGK